MMRKISALAFLTVMAIVVTFKHPVLGYCLCLDSFFAGSECVCHTDEAGHDLSSNGSSSAAGFPDCCTTNNPDNLLKGHTGEENISATPCKGCTETFNIDVGDFVWQSSFELPSDSEYDLAQPAHQAVAPDLFLPELVYSVAPIRGDPPPDTLPGVDPLPIYLRHSVLRL